MAFRAQKTQFFICFKVNPQKNIKNKNKTEKIKNFAQSKK